MKRMLFFLCASTQLLTAALPRVPLEKLLDENASIPTIAQAVNQTDLSGCSMQCISKLLSRVQPICLSNTGDTSCAQWIYHQIHQQYSNSGAFKDILTLYDGMLNYSGKFGEYTLPLAPERPSQPVHPQELPQPTFQATPQEEYTEPSQAQTADDKKPLLGTYKRAGLIILGGIACWYLGYQKGASQGHKKPTKS